MTSQSLLVSDQISEEIDIDGVKTTIDRWKNTVYRQPVLTAEEETRLALRWFDKRDIDAAKQLVFSHARMVLPVARAYRGYGLPEEDLVQQGNVGLVKAVNKFDPHHGARLASYALAWIKSEIQQYIVDNWQMVRMVKTKAQRKLFFHKSMLNTHLQSLQDQDKKTIAEALNVSIDDVSDMEKHVGVQFKTLDEPVFDGRTLHDVVADTSEVTDEPDFYKLIDSGILSDVMESLDERSRYIIHQRWIEGGKTLHDLAAEFKVSAERIRQIEVKAMKKMKTELEKYLD